MSSRDKKDRRPGPPGRRQGWTLIDLLLIGLYAVVAIVIVVGLIAFMIWGLATE